MKVEVEEDQVPLGRILPACGVVPERELMLGGEVVLGDKARVVQ